MPSLTVVGDSDKEISHWIYGKYWWVIGKNPDISMLKAAGV